MTTAPARADGPSIVLESYTGGRPDDVARYVSPILDELAKHGYVAGYDAVGRKFEVKESRAAVTGGGLPATFRADVERGRTEWARGKFDEALKILTPLVEAARASPGQLVQDAGLRDVLRDALIAVALSRKGQGDLDGMNQAFAELVRSFPAASPGPNYGPEANRAFDAVRKDMLARSGKLAVRVSDDGVAVYVNEQLEGVGDVHKAGMAPGEYRVLVKSSRQISRSHRVVVHAGDESALSIDLGFDAAIHIAADWTGLMFANATDREQLEGVYAQQLANSIDAGAVAVVGTEIVQGRTMIVGALINLKNGRELRRATIAADSAPQVDRLRALAKFLTGEAPSSGIDVLVNGDGSGPPLPLSRPSLAPNAGVRVAAGASREPPASDGRWRGWKWIAGGATVGALAAGTIQVVLNGRCSAQPADPHLKCPRQYQTLPGGLATLGGGAVLAGITVYLWVTGDSTAPSKTAYLVPTDGGAIAGLSARF